MSGLVTGEGVILDLRVARLPTRALAFALDALLLLAIGVGLSFVLGAAVSLADPALAATLGLVAVVAVLVAVPVAVETLTHGRSLGKLALGLRVVRDDGGPVRFRHSLTRGLAGFFVDFWLVLGVGAVVTSMLSKDAKRLGDLMAGTLVVKEGTPARILPLPPMPAGLERWARTLELARLPDDLALAVRTYLTRSGSLAPAARASMATSLADAVAAHVSPAPPAGTPAWAYLAAVLAERRRRSEASLHAYLRSAQTWPARPTPTSSPVVRSADPRRPAPHAGQATTTSAPPVDGFVPPA